MLLSLHLHMEAKVLQSSIIWYVRTMLKYIFQGNETLIIYV